MTIKTGDNMPEGRFTIMKADGPGSVSSKEFFEGKKVVLFSVPGAFTPTCSRQHLPGFVEKAAEFQQKGVNAIACMAVNDVFVMDAWGKSADADGKVTMLADGNGDYARALGLELDATGFGMGKRGQRFALVVDNGKVSHVFIEEAGKFKVSSAEHVLASL
jgi:peroxiredoxin